MNLFIYFYRDAAIHCSVTITEDGERALVQLAHGDMRRVLNVLQVQYITPLSELIDFSIVVLCRAQRWHSTR